MFCIVQALYIFYWRLCGHLVHSADKQSNRTGKQHGNRCSSTTGQPNSKAGSKYYSVGFCISYCIKELTFCVVHALCFRCSVRPSHGNVVGSYFSCVLCRNCCPGLDRTCCRWALLHFMDLAILRWLMSVVPGPNYKRKYVWI